ncbi:MULTISPECIES: hypothetical protein [Moorena]|uniref:Uncharacterized protein n=1 Tax=Moorena producens 3L TaxID=489825 RepID=F4XUV2_9CYAN|nr:MULTISPECIES: hypothetical protein [Moorena]EGJ31655.1 hypothetical protein LYNGBM3L_35730 [Moorena producens 3L]NEP33462.1 hypothetical protein [Moorena sp. SIO3B2]NER86436.1 hypothetical protein [Moorena sp. SIO3A2]NET63066.1 hypothetical protein [Moorena sp. SIO1G6]
MTIITAKGNRFLAVNGQVYKVCQGQLCPEHWLITDLFTQIKSTVISQW